MGNQEETAQMQKFIRGIDKGYAMIFSLVLILILSIICFTLIPRTSAIKHFANNYKIKTIKSIEKSNLELIKLYDLN